MKLTCAKFAVPLITVCFLAAQSEPNRGQWGDLGNNIYANPIMPTDVGDLDAIRVGSDYYAISSTQQYSPGLAILHSKDLVNWQFIGHAVQDVTSISPELNWDKMGLPGKGMWASAIRYHAGKYWIYFTSPENGLFMTTALKPAGPWAPLKIVWSVAGWDDPCPFWDEDGQAYLVITNFALDPANGNKYNIHLFKMDSDGERLVASSDRIIHQSKGSEANKLYKINGLYYHYFSEVHAEGRVAMLERARTLSGPWEIHQLNHVNRSIDKEPNQGGLVQVPSGEWYFVTHQGTGDWEGRAGVLLPVTWSNGWPIIGAVGSDGIGNMVWRGKKPISGYPETDLWASDDFSSDKLRPEWEFNYQPRSDKWSLRERQGCLRLHAFPSLRPRDFTGVGNVVSQRAMRTSENQFTALIDLDGLAEGQEAGLVHYAKTYCAIAVLRKAGTTKLMLNRNGARSEGSEILEKRLWLRSTWGFDGQSQFSYSLDGNRFKNVGEPYPLTWAFYRGDRIGLFTFNDSGEAGYLDIDSVSYTATRSK